MIKKIKEIFGKIKKALSVIIRFFKTIPDVVKACPQAFILGIVAFIFATIILGMIFGWGWFGGFFTGFSFIAVCLFVYSVYLHENNA